MDDDERAWLRELLTTSYKRALREGHVEAARYLLRHCLGALTREETQRKRARRSERKRRRVEGKIGKHRVRLDVPAEMVEE